MTYAVTFQQTESGMDYKVHQIPEGYCLDAHRRQKLKSSHTLLNLYGGYVAGLKRIHSSSLKKKIVIGAEMLVTTCQIRRCHISEDRHLNAHFVLHWWTEPLGLAFYPTWKKGGQHEESKQSAGAPYLESCHASHRLNCEQRKQAGYLIR